MRAVRAFLAAAVAFTAIPSGIAMLVAHDGASWLPLALLDPTPFHDFLIPGLLLGAVVGGSALVALIAEVRGARGAARASFVAGAILLGWMIGEVVLLRAFSWLQPPYFLVAVAQMLFAWRIAMGADADQRAEHRAKRFLAYRRVAFVGLSSKPDDFSHAVAKALLASGVEVVPVNPNVPGAHPTVASIPNPPKAVLVMLPAASAEAAVGDAIGAHAEAIWFHRGVGAGSATDAAVALAHKAGMLVIRDACPLMFLDGIEGATLHRAHRAIRRSAWSGQ